MQIALLPHARETGVNGPADFANPEIRHARVVGLEAAFASSWPTDAHFLGYNVVGPDGEPLEEWPRINKPALGHVREAGHDVRTVLLAYDWDCPGHLAWPESPISREQYLEGLDRACAADPLLGSWACRYYTAKGARIVYALAESLAPEDSEAAWQVIGRRLDAQGVAVDFRTPDWTRLMRAPMVLRDGVRTEEQDYFDIDLRPEMRLDLSGVDLSARKRASDYADLSAVKDPSAGRPTDEEARSLIEVMSGGRWRYTDFRAAASRALKGSSVYDGIFNRSPMFPIEGPGANTAMTEAVGVVCARLLPKIPYVEPRHVYALLRERASEIGPYKARLRMEDWLECLWDLCRRLWVKEKAKLEAVRQKAAEAEEAAARVAEDAKAHWIEDPRLGNGDAMARLSRGGDLDTLRAVQSVAIAVKGSYCFVMRPDGRYSSKPISRDGVLGEIRLSGSESLIPLSYLGDDGKARQRTSKNVMDAHAVTVTRICRKFMSQEESGYIEGIASEDPCLWFALDSRDPSIVPAHDPDVAEWLRLLDPTGRIERWLSYGPACDQGAICGLFVIGPPSSGKNMLAQGLAECFVNKTYARSEELVSGFQRALARSCVVQIDEDLPRSNGPFSMDAIFRNIVTAGRISINEKFGPSYDVYSSPRIIGTANNKGIVAKLFPSSHAEADDRAAILERLMMVETDGRATEWLRQRGGHNFTGRPGRRWVGSQQGDASDFVLAKHIMWLYANRPVKQGMPPGHSRLLVQGASVEEDVAMANVMVAGNDTSSAVSEAILHLFMAEDRRRADDPKSGSWIDRDNLRFWTTASAVRETIFKVLSDKYPRKPSLTAISGALRCLRSFGSPDRPIVQAKRPQIGKVMWYDVDLEQVEAFAMELGGEASQFLEFCECHRILREETKKVGHSRSSG